MRYIHDGELRNRTVDLPPVFVFDEAGTPGTGRTNTALRLAAKFGGDLAKQRRAETPLLIDHERKRWRVGQ